MASIPFTHAVVAAQLLRTSPPLEMPPQPSNFLNLGRNYAPLNKKVNENGEAEILGWAGMSENRNLTLQDLRKAKELTQAQLAETLGIRQATVAQMEKRSDLMLSTLRSYVRAMGGDLRLMVESPGKNPVGLDGLGIVKKTPSRNPVMPYAMAKMVRGCCP